MQRMFDAIAGTYERFNTLATFGRDAAWRRCAVAAAAPRRGDLVLDLCCGTGDMLRAFAAAEPALALLVGVDFSRGMLDRADFAGVRVPVQLLQADALRLPLADATADIIACAFGVRNFADVRAGLDEMARVARPGARVVILEFATPDNRFLRALYQFYCDRVLPLLGAALSRAGSGAYAYLPRSIRTFETTRTMLGRLTAAGFSDVRVRRLNLGGVAVYSGTKPPPAG
ncbi:MAG: ubiquinone/menaquinone biosynthesis methyltransferase [Planctomycetota bacterium]